MNYPEIFKEKVIKYYTEKGIFDSNEQFLIFIRNSITSSLNEGSKYIGEMLKDDSEEQFSAEDIVNAFNNKTLLKDLLRKAQMTLKAKELFEEWRQIYFNMTQDVVIDRTPKTK